MMKRGWVVFTCVTCSPLAYGPISSLQQHKIDAKPKKNAVHKQHEILENSDGMVVFLSF
jgi:hypothetical protein